MKAEKVGETDHMAPSLLPTADEHSLRQVKSLRKGETLSVVTQVHLFSLKVKWYPIFRDGVRRDQSRIQEMDAPKSDQKSSLVPQASL